MNTEYWKRFENSGKIEDYLAFLNFDEAGEAKDGGQSGADSDAGIYHSDGNHIEAVSRGGVRQAYQPFDEGER